jgi:alpha-tubulin suppressor-like RCC1 family protein
MLRRLPGFHPRLSLAAPGLGVSIVVIALGGLAATSAEAVSVRAISSGSTHSCAVTTAGGVKCWGQNGNGQLGDGTTTNSSQPVDVEGLEAGVRAVVAGRNFTCALTTAGGVKCWGSNSYGQLGDGTTIDHSTPVEVVGLTAGVATLGGAAMYHACAVTTAGAAKCWGSNVHGELGNGTAVSASMPVDVSGLASGVASVEARGYHTCALTTAGSVSCWGYNVSGAVGDGTTTDRWAPVGVSGLTSGVIAITGGLHFSCALQSAGAVKCWGANGDGQLGDGTTTNRLSPVTVSGLAAAAGLDAGAASPCALLSEGGLRCWGDNASGQLGDGTTSDRTAPVAVAGLMSDPAVPAPGFGHSCALLASGRVQCWGDNAYGQVGDGTTTDRLAPVTVRGLSGGEGAWASGAVRVSSQQVFGCVLTSRGGVKCWRAAGPPADVPGLSSGVAAMGAGGYHGCALTTNGGVKCWGSNFSGQLGDGTTADRPVAADVSGLASGVAALAVGYEHNCAVMAAGGVKCWGNNDSGQLGDGTKTTRLTPVDVSGLTSGVAAATAGNRHSCVLTSAGGARCWGDNSHGALGDATGTERLTPVWVSGLTSGVSVLSAGGYGTCAVTSSGGAKCWGDNQYGQVGDGTTVTRNAPVDVLGLGSDVLAIRPSVENTCAIRRAGRLQCWGNNDYGEVGDGTNTDRTTAVDVSGLSSGVTDVAVAYRFTCAVTGSGGVQCWGNNIAGQLGDGTTVNRWTPVWVTGLVGGRGRIAAGGLHTCRMTAAGGVQCWGYNAMGQLGDGTTTNRRTPVDVTGLTSGVAAIASAGNHTCAVTTGGGVKCWGYNLYGQLGDGTTTDRWTPVDVVGLTSGVAAVAVGGSHTCAITTSGGTKCWGANYGGNLGDGTTTSRLAPVWVLGLADGVSAVSTNSVHTCALTTGGGMKCWGHNVYGVLGDGTTTDRPAPVWVSGLSSGVGGIAVGPGHSCALLTDGGVRCWGHNAYGEVGDGTTAQRLTPVSVSITGAIDLTAASDHTCALTRSGTLMCWGANSYGQLGDGTTTNRLSPVTVAGLTSGAAAPLAGQFHTCAVVATGGVECWGDNPYGQLGNGTKASRSVPTMVRGAKQWRDFDGDFKSDVAVYRPASGTWFSLDSSVNNASFRSLGWGIQASGDAPAPGDYDGDGLVDPTVFRPSTGTWFTLESHSSYTTWSYVGWGAADDTLVPADYDGDGKTDVAVYRPSTGTWYVRPSDGTAQWNVVFGQSGDVPVPGDYDGDDKTDVAVYRPSTGTWFVLTSSSGFTSFWYRGWGIDAQGDQPIPADFDGDGKVDLSVFRPATGTWFVLESHANYSTWTWFGWGASTDTLVPADFDGDGAADAAVYRPSTGTWYVRPSSGATSWNVVFGQSGDVPILK